MSESLDNAYQEPLDLDNLERWARAHHDMITARVVLHLTQRVRDAENLILKLQPVKFQDVKHFTEEGAP